LKGEGHKRNDKVKFDCLGQEKRMKRSELKQRRGQNNNNKIKLEGKKE